MHKFILSFKKNPTFKEVAAPVERTYVNAIDDVSVHFPLTLICCWALAFLPHKHVGRCKGHIIDGNSADTPTSFIWFKWSFSLSLCVCVFHCESACCSVETCLCKSLRCRPAAQSASLSTFGLCLLQQKLMNVKIPQWRWSFSISGLQLTVDLRRPRITWNNRKYIGYFAAT